MLDIIWALGILLFSVYPLPTDLFSPPSTMDARCAFRIRTANMHLTTKLYEIVRMPEISSGDHHRRQIHIDSVCVCSAAENILGLKVNTRARTAHTSQFCTMCFERSCDTFCSSSESRAERERDREKNVEFPQRSAISFCLFLSIWLRLHVASVVLRRLRLRLLFRRRICAMAIGQKHRFALIENRLRENVKCFARAQPLAVFCFIGICCDFLYALVPLSRLLCSSFEHRVCDVSRPHFRVHQMDSAQLSSKRKRKICKVSAEADSLFQRILR